MGVRGGPWHEKTWQFSDLLTSGFPPLWVLKALWTIRLWGIWRTAPLARNQSLPFLWRCRPHSLMQNESHGNLKMHRNPGAFLGRKKNQLKNSPRCFRSHLQNL